ncbi:unnamed protein product [Mycena citricolor]|uniref:Uncharacterized protein n=1 Tax=Mycena citricolor TaxID=2018698 RepID=A0AAD2GXE9_9AGAR|nr:unnamed protein product [Mycena citricolor]
MINAIKAPSFLRPTSRPSSPAPPAASNPRSESMERAARPLTKLSSLSNFRRPSPASGPPPTPAPVPLVQDGSYLETLALKLSEAVSKALANPVGPLGTNDAVNGKRPIPTGRGRALGSFISAELGATRDNPHLNRAIIRSLLRPLSVLLSNLSAHLLPIISSPAFLSPPAPTLQAAAPNATQLHALSVAGFAGEVLEVFDDLGLGLDGDARGDGLKVIREGLVSIVNRVVSPLVAGIKHEMMLLLDALETPNSPKMAAGAKNAPVLHPSIVVLTSVMPVYARALTRYSASRCAQALLAPFVISVVWRGLVALASRPIGALSPPSPNLLPVHQGHSPSITPPVTPPSARFTIKLPPSRPPSPPSAALPASAAADARALYELLSTLPRPVSKSESARVANEAIEEAFEGLKAFAPFFDAVQANPNLPEEQLDALTEELPTLVALCVLLHVHSGRSVADMLGLAEEDYKKACLSGFGRAEECASAVGQRVLHIMRRESTSPAVIVEWLEDELADIASGH